MTADSFERVWTKTLEQILEQLEVSYEEGP